MLDHTSGIPDTNDYGWDRPEFDDGALDRYVRSLGGLKLEFDSGARWSYSNVAYEVLGDVIARVSGVSFERYEELHVLKPLGMARSTFLMSEVDPELRTTGHVWDLVPVVAPVYPYDRAHAPSSTLHSNVDEICIWMNAHLARGAWQGRRILAPETYDEMWSAGPVTEIDGQRMGLGWFQGRVRGLETWGHRGGDTGFRSWVELIPSASVGVFVASNSNMGSAVRAVAQAALDVALGYDTGRIRTPIRYVFGRTLEEQGLEPAIAQYLELCETRRRDCAFGADSLLQIGVASMERERTCEAREVFQLCADEYPNSALALGYLGGACLELEEFELAEQYLRESLELDPSDERVRTTLHELEQRAR